MNLITRNWISLAIIVHIIAAWFSLGHYHDDEYHQILAFTAFKSGLLESEFLRWEYASQLRSGFQPFVAYIIKFPFSIIGIDSPHVHTFVLRLISGALSLYGIFLFSSVIFRKLENRKILFWSQIFLFFFWLQVFINIRFSSEGWATSLFVLAFSIFLTNTQKYSKLFFISGLLFGFSFLCRYQAGLMLLGLGLWMIFINKIGYKGLVSILAGGVIALIIGFLCDWWLYEEIVFTPWNYLNTNIFQGRVETFTHEPWWYYGYYLSVQTLPPVSLIAPVVVISFWVLFKAHPITWITIPFVLFHHYIGHKEMRFLFPVLIFMPVMYAFLIDYICSIESKLNFHLFKKILRSLFFISVAINILLLLLVMLLPASKEAAMWKKCISDINDPEDTVLLTYDIGELDMHFYNTQNIKLISTDIKPQLNDLVNEYKQNNIFIATRRSSHLDELSASGLQYNLECQITPDWMVYLNFNDWTSRASLWRLWEIKTN